MKAIPLKASIREVTGKKVKLARAAGMLPVNVYGKAMQSTALSLPVGEFMAIYRKAGATGLVELSFGEQKKPTLIKHVQFHPLTRLPLHAEFQVVSLTETIKANVPIELVGESPAVSSNIGIVLQNLNEVEVEALPTDLPEAIQVDVATLTEVDQRILVSDLKAPHGVTILTGADEVVVSVASAVSEETQKELAEEEAAKTDEAAAEGEAAPQEGGSEAAGEGGKEAASEEK